MLVVFGVYARYYFLTKSNILRNENQVSQQVSPPASRVYSNAKEWKTYKDSEIGLEFQYPASVNGEATEIIRKQIGNEFSYGIARYSTSTYDLGGRYLSEFDQYLGLYFYFLRDSKQYVGLGNVYFNGVERQWYMVKSENAGGLESRIISEKKISWDEAESLLRQNDRYQSLTGAQWPILKTTDGVVAYPRSTKSGQESSVSYIIVNRDKLAYIDLGIVRLIMGNVNPSELKSQSELFESIMKKMVQTIKF